MSCELDEIQIYTVSGLSWVHRAIIELGVSLNLLFVSSLPVLCKVSWKASRKVQTWFHGKLRGRFHGQFHVRLCGNITVGAYVKRKCMTCVKPDVADKS